MATLYELGKEPCKFEPEGKSFTLSEMQKLVGGNIELVTLRSSGMYLVIHEEGKMMGLPRNAEATAVCEDFLFPGDFIVGDAFMCSAEELGE